MRRAFVALVVAAATLVAKPLAPAPSSPPAREIENVAAFARLYGVVRWFYPSDAAAQLDWNRMAVLGVSRVRAAADDGTLAGELRRLFEPLGPGIEVDPTLGPAPAAVPGGPLVAWRHLGAGFAALGPYRSKRTHRLPLSASSGFFTLMQAMPAEHLRGKTLRLRARARASGPERTGGALWLRVDRQGNRMGFFDNMGDRPIRDGAWKSYSIEGPVADDATYVFFGVMGVGATTADFDDVELHARDAEGDFRPLPVEDGGFEEPMTDDRQGSWMPTGSLAVKVSRPTDEPPGGGRYARLAPPPPGSADEELFAEGAPVPGASVTFEVGSALQARVPLALSDDAARGQPARAETLSALSAAIASLPEATGDPGLDQRLADVVVAWSTLRHFFPYWQETGVDWDARLTPQLRAAASSRTRSEQADALRGLFADLRDGHGGVRDMLDRVERGELPLALADVEGRLLVVGSGTPDVPIGAEILAVDGERASERVARDAGLGSGSDRWRRTRACQEIVYGPLASPVRLRVDDGSGPREVTLHRATRPAPGPKRPEAVAEVEPGLFYVDLTRVRMDELEPKLAVLAAGRGVVFDVRGYPTDAGLGILPHLLDVPESDRWMHVPKIVGPFFQVAGWKGMGWDLQPKPPRIAGRVVFLTHAGAISYAESVMGYVSDRKLGTIVGGTTAGTNGNVASFGTPSGYGVAFTGMRVTRHDGSSPFHLLGVAPDVAVEPTIAGLRAGRDEVLERGLAIARQPSP